MQSNMSEENIEASKNTANNAIDAYTANISASLTRLTDINTKLTGKIETLRGKIADYKNNHTLVTKLDIIKQLGELNSLMNEVINANNEFNNSLKPILEHFKDIDNDNGGNNQFLYDSLISSLDLMPALLKTAAQNMTTFTHSINSLNSILTSSINDSVGKSGELFKTSINSIYDSLVSASDSLSAISTIINGVDSTLSSVNFTLDTMGELIGNVQNTLDKANTELAALKDDGKYELMQKLLDKDSSEYGEFFSSPVKVTTENVYEAVNYGTAVAPFYTTLALWVGGLLLTALIKTSPDDREEFKNATLTQKYFGRYLIFWLMGQIQAVITVLGDIYLLKIYCVHPGIFMLTASIVSFAFTLLIYTLTLSFGDVGKALAVVLVVIQIAGSSGTYPIELLPSFFRNVYIYFPFPYAINAIRECVSGFYRYDYFILMGQLMLFVIGTLFLGLFLRKPFMKLNHYMHHRMHDTKLM